ncbi:MAG: HEPN domain-containing protein [Candidatus Woesearchaeota archaeon]|nr:HEPN domain-containing protein [Candidatus Woesearchaeota archaeon]
MAKYILNSEKPKYVLENAYEAIRELIDAILFLGYKSYSHEAAVAYLVNLGFSVTETMAVDRLRKMRNGIKYYGEDTTPKEAEHALKTAEEVISKLLKLKTELKKSP